MNLETIQQAETANHFYKESQKSLNKSNYSNALNNIKEAIKLKQNEAKYYNLYGLILYDTLE